MEHHPIHQKVAGLIPHQGTYLGCGFDPWSGHAWEATDCFSLTFLSLSLFPPPLPLSLKSINISLGEVKKKRHKAVKWRRKQEPHICCLQESHLRTKDTHRLRVKRWKKNFHEKENGKQKAGIAILISDKKTLKRRL